MMTPAPVTLRNLQRDYKERYGVDLSQIEIMLESSSKSLVLADFDRIVTEMQVGMADILFYCRDKGQENS